MKIGTPLYRLNKSELKYDKIKIRYKSILIFIIFQLFLTVSLMFLLSKTFNTPKEIQLKKKISQLEYEFYVVDKKTDGIYYQLGLLQQKDSIIYQTLFNTAEIASIDIDIRPDTVKDIETKLSNIEKLLYVGNVKLKRVIQEIVKTDDVLKHTPAIQPISNKDLTRTSSGFGVRIHPIYKTKKFHYGMDFAAPVGTPIYATADGVVVRADPKYLSYGKYIKINHGYGYQTAYGHLEGIGVKKNQKVVRGQIIGVVGNSGISTGPHLHYEVIHEGKFVDPINHYFNDLTIEEYERMLGITKTIKVSMD
jgi:hypothetical protein